MKSFAQLMLVWCLASSTFPVLGQEIFIPDPGLNAAIRDALVKPVGPLTRQDLLSLTDLHAENRNISRVEGLEAAGNLATLFLQGNHLTQLAIPLGLKHLVQLDLRTNNLTSLTLAQDLTNLTVLSLEGNPLETLVLSEPMAQGHLAGVAALLRSKGVAVFTFQLTVQLTRLRQPIGAFQFALMGPPGVYNILSATNLSAWSATGVTTNQTGSFVFTDGTAHLSPQKFYRAVLQGPPTNMVFIRPNTFVMGSPSNEQDRNANEGPQTTVTLTRGFWIGRYEVTQGDYLSLMNTNPSYFPGDLNRAVSSVSWLDATNYCAKLTERELAAGRILSGSHFRLPTEAEWECAARAGTSTRFSYGDDPGYQSLTNHGWFSANGDLMVHAVGQKLPNPWGLYDMEGNVWEWCQDWFGALPGGVRTDPTGPVSNPGGWKVMRGGAYDYPESSCRSAARLFFPLSPFLTDSDLGFRVVLVTEP